MDRITPENSGYTLPGDFKGEECLVNSNKCVSLPIKNTFEVKIPISGISKLMQASVSAW
jgi:hypothetical protein